MQAGLLRSPDLAVVPIIMCRQSLSQRDACAPCSPRSSFLFLWQLAYWENKGRTLSFLRLPVACGGGWISIPHTVSLSRSGTAYPLPRTRLGRTDSDRESLSRSACEVTLKTLMKSATCDSGTWHIQRD
jgi:hypothetical protein